MIHTWSYRTTAQAPEKGSDAQIPVHIRHSASNYSSTPRDLPVCHAEVQPEQVQFDPSDRRRNARVHPHCSRASQGRCGREDVLPCHMVSAFLRHPLVYAMNHFAISNLELHYSTPQLGDVARF